MIHADQTLGDVVASHPAASQVFLRHRLDFCCGGHRKLSQACQQAGLDPETVISEISQIAADPKTDATESWATRPLETLIDFIVARYHDRLRADLPALIAAAKRVEHVHGDKQSCPRGLASHLEHVHAEMQQHMVKEEQMLFPAIRGGSRGAQIHMPVRVMMQEHDDHAENLRRSRELTGDFEPPPEACGTWRALYAALYQLESDLMVHMHLENNVLFARALDA